MSTIHRYLTTFFRILVTHEPLILLLCFQLLLRIPNLFEPYWYGDEAIYLTIGAGLRQGLRLYAETIDHKTPLIYYFAMVPTQFWFRILNIVWTSISTILFFTIAKKLKFSSLQQYIATFLFVIYTTLPWLEGNIPNGELFVMGFTLAGTYLVTLTGYFQSFINQQRIQLKKKDYKLLFLAGILFGLGILTKVPGLFEIVPFAFIGWFILLRRIDRVHLSQSLKPIVSSWIVLSAGIVFPIVLSIAYYYVRGSLEDYLNFGLLYNFRYAGNWALPFTEPWLVWLFSLKGKVLVLSIILVTLTLSRKSLTPQTKLLVAWFAASLFASVLSSRPYPHYMMQVVPGAVLLFTWSIFTKKAMIINRVAGILCLVILIAVLQLLEFRYYNSVSYYNRFGQFITKKLSKEQYFHSFDQLMSDNYEVATILKSSSQPRFFIWGTNPTLYALTQKPQVGRFTVSFHIKDFEGAFDETFSAIGTYEPDFIVVMKNETHPFPQLFDYIDRHYREYKDFEHFILYKRSSIELL